MTKGAGFNIHSYRPSDPRRKKQILQFGLTPILGGHHTWHHTQAVVTAMFDAFWNDTDLVCTVKEMFDTKKAWEHQTWYCDDTHSYPVLAALKTKPMNPGKWNVNDEFERGSHSPMIVFMGDDSSRSPASHKTRNGKWKKKTASQGSGWQVRCHGRPPVAEPNLTATRLVIQRLGLRVVPQRVGR